MSMYMAYKKLVSGYERTRRITPTQHVELVTILEKVLPSGVLGTLDPIPSLGTPKLRRLLGRLLAMHRTFPSVCQLFS